MKIRFSFCVPFLGGASVDMDIVKCIRWVMKKFGFKKFDVHHLEVIATLELISENVSKYTRKIVGMPQRSGVKEFPNGYMEYKGNECDISVKEVNDFKYEKGEANGRKSYIIRPQGIIQKGVPFAYTLEANLRNDNRKAECKNAFFIHRPTKKLVLIVKVPKGISIKNVRYEGYNPGSELVKDVYLSSDLKTNVSEHFVEYIFEIPNPKIGNESPHSHKHKHPQ